MLSLLYCINILINNILYLHQLIQYYEIYLNICLDIFLHKIPYINIHIKVYFNIFDYKDFYHIIQNIFYCIQNVNKIIYKDLNIIYINHHIYINIYHHNNTQFNIFICIHNNLINKVINICDHNLKFSHIFINMENETY